MGQTLAAAMLSVALMLAMAGCGGQMDDTATAASPASEPSPSPAIASHQSSPAIAEAAVNDELGNLKQDLSMLKREVASLRQQISSLSTVVNEEGRGPGKEAAAAEVAFRKEPTDPSWSQAVATRVRAALSQSDDGFATQVRSIECRSSTCRVEILPEGDDAIEQNLSTIFSQLAPTFSNVSASKLDVASGGQATVLYLLR